jgi:hypothetical protein
MRLSALIMAMVGFVSEMAWFASRKIAKNTDN